MESGRGTFALPSMPRLATHIPETNLVGVEIPHGLALIFNKVEPCVHWQHGQHFPQRESQIVLFQDDLVKGDYGADGYYLIILDNHDKKPFLLFHERCVDAGCPHMHVVDPNLEAEMVKAINDCCPGSRVQILPVVEIENHWVRLPVFLKSAQLSFVP